MRSRVIHVSTDVIFRSATEADLPTIVALLADDLIAAGREGGSGSEAAESGAYLKAFHEVDADPRNHLIVADLDGEVAGTLQLTYIPGVSRMGTERAQIEAVRVAAAHRGRGLGREMITWAVDQARARGCGLVQLTSDQRRTDAIRFYASLGFEPTHVGMKLSL
jgi:GNAT superfamily N-acetyltransferase